MMRWIVESSLKFRLLVVAAAAALLGIGVVQLRDMPVDIHPEFAPIQVEVQTEALGLSAKEVEQLITVPLEQDLLVGVPFLAQIESASLSGLSSVLMTFEPGTDLLDARQVVQERLSQATGAAGLPEVAKLPQMIQPVSSNRRVSMITLSSEEALNPIDVSVLAWWVISPRLMGVPGVANVTVWGFRDRQLQVLVDPQQLRQSNTTLAQVIETAGNALEVLAADVPRGLHPWHWGVYRHGQPAAQHLPRAGDYDGRRARPGAARRYWRHDTEGVGRGNDSSWRTPNRSSGMPSAPVTNSACSSSSRSFRAPTPSR